MNIWKLSDTNYGCSDEFLFSSRKKAVGAAIEMMASIYDTKAAVKDLTADGCYHVLVIEGTDSNLEDWEQKEIWVTEEKVY